MKFQTVDGKLVVTAETIDDMRVLLSIQKSEGIIHASHVSQKKLDALEKNRSKRWIHVKCKHEGCHFVSHSGTRGLIMHTAAMHEGKGRWHKNDKPADDMSGK